MEVVFILLPVALLVAAIMLALFIWAVRSGQFDDLETPAVRILFDDHPRSRTSEGASSSSQGAAGSESSRDSGGGNKQEEQGEKAEVPPLSQEFRAFNHLPGT
jgi:cbb3-type cytochrome oxidase maturation protein